MDKIIESIEKAMLNENFFGALFMAVCIPEICGKIEFSNSKRPYKEWFEKYMPKRYLGHLSGSDAYAIRCALLHEASSNLIHQRARDVLDNFYFTNTGSHLITFKGINGDRKRRCVMSYTAYCNDLITAYSEWQKTTLSKDDLTRARFEKSESLRLRLEVGDAIPGVKFG